MLKRILALTIIGLVACTSARTENAPKGNIHPDLKLSFSERTRLVTWDNAITLDDEVDGTNTFTRHRTSLMGQYYPTDKIEFGLKLTNEFRYYFTPDDVDFEIHEVFFDQLYFKYKSEYYTLTLGRQNIMIGEGFVLLDGGPLDGSRSAYFNAARLDWKAAPNQTVTLFYAYQPRQDDYLPLINDQCKDLIEDPEQSFGAYYTAKPGEAEIHGYFIRKNIDSEPDKSGINTIGGRLAYPLLDELAFTVEGAIQFGDYRDDTQIAQGGYGYIDYKPGGPAWLPSMITAGGVYLSGDRPGTSDHEGWEPLFGRWPKWSESYIYTLLNERNGIAYWSNYASVFGRLEFAPCKRITCRGEYQHLWAPRATTVVMELIPWWYCPGSDRGNMLIGKLIFKFNKYLSGHALWEHFIPGDFYDPNADSFDWVRFELMISVS